MVARGREEVEESSLGVLGREEDCSVELRHTGRDYSLSRGDAGCNQVSASGVVQRRREQSQPRNPFSHRIEEGDKRVVLLQVWLREASHQPGLQNCRSDVEVVQ